MRVNIEQQETPSWVCNDLRPFVFNSEYFKGQPRLPFSEQTVLFKEARGFCVGEYENAHLSTVKDLT